MQWKRHCRLLAQRFGSFVEDVHVTAICEQPVTLSTGDLVENAETLQVIDG